MTDCDPADFTACKLSLRAAADPVFALALKQYEEARADHAAADTAMWLGWEAMDARHLAERENVRAGVESFEKGAKECFGVLTMLIAEDKARVGADPLATIKTPRP